MMDTVFAVYLWVIVFSILCWLVTPETVTTEGEEYRLREMVVDTDNLIYQDTLGSVELEKVNNKEMRLSEEVQDNQGILEMKINNLTARQARKIAGKLNIPQKINGKDAPKHLLIQHIQLKATMQQEQVAEALQQVITTVEIVSHRR